jgi:hypothetical protein
MPRGFGHGHDPNCTRCGGHTPEPKPTLADIKQKLMDLFLSFIAIFFPTNSEFKERQQQAEVKKTYRKLALKWHPDKNGGSEESVIQMSKINLAYELVLKDLEKGKGGDAQGNKPVWDEEPSDEEDDHIQRDFKKYFEQLRKRQAQEANFHKQFKAQQETAAQKAKEEESYRSPHQQKAYKRKMEKLKDPTDAHFLPLEDCMHRLAVCLRGNLPLVFRHQLLLSRSNFSLPLPQAAGNTVLHFAAYYGRVDEVQFIISCLGGSWFKLVLRKNEAGRTPLDVALGMQGDEPARAAAARERRREAAELDRKRGMKGVNPRKRRAIRRA